MKFWGEHFKAKYQGATTFPELAMQELCSGSDVLEIGPGEGRQFGKLVSISKSYSVADICQEVLDQEMYDKCLSKILITSYLVDRIGGERFDVVHCWYVLHHVHPDMVSGFIGMMIGFCRPGGYVAFNFPVEGDGDNHDGTMTYANSTEIESFIGSLSDAGGVDVVAREHMGSRNSVIVMRKK